MQPLHVAVVLGDVGAIGALAAAGASLNAQNALGTSPLQLAIVRNQRGAVEALKARGARMKPAHIVSGTVAGSADLSNGAALEGAGVSLEDIALVKASWAFVSGALLCIVLCTVGRLQWLAPGWQRCGGCCCRSMPLRHACG